MIELNQRWAADALDSPRGNLGACMWIRRELERQMEGLISDGQRLIQYGGSIETFDRALDHLNARAATMRTHILAAVELRDRRALQDPSAGAGVLGSGVGTGPDSRE